MSTPWILYRLYSLDPSSPDFPCRLHSLIRYDEEEQYLSSLQGSQLARLLDFLDQVRTLPSTFCPVTKRVLQTLGNISTDDDLSRQCLHKLQAICGHRATLPSSYIISGEITRSDDHPIALCGTVGVWEGTYRGKKVSIKTLRAPLTDNETLKKVRIPCSTLHRVHSRTPADLAVILQRGCRVEKVKAPEHRPFHRRCNKPFANRFGVDAERNSDRVH